MFERKLDPVHLIKFRSWVCPIGFKVLSSFLLLSNNDTKATTESRFLRRTGSRYPNAAKNTRLAGL